MHRFKDLNKNIYINSEHIRTSTREMKVTDKNKHKILENSISETKCPVDDFTSYWILLKIEVSEQMNISTNFKAQREK